jgi:acetoin:2,6-dichlorophenolindophenol oxidoreductase subunit beta
MNAPRISMAAAINQALDLELGRDESVFLLGEDIVDPSGGVMKVTAGLSTKYGHARVRETPISEQAIIGAASGAALLGMRPVAEIMIADFYAVCLDQLVNHAAKLRYMSGGRTHVPITIRGMATGGMMFGAQHSQMVEAWFAHVPGLKIAIPSTPADAKGMLTAAIRDDDPTIVIEPAALYSVKGPVPEGEHVVALGSADIKRPGTDVTIITYGKQVHDSLEAARQLEGEVDVEVLDLRSIVPWDAVAMLDSVRRTRRAVVVHQAVQRFGVGAEIAAWLSQELWGTLAAPILRVGAEYTPVPYSPQLEAAHMPSVARIVESVHAVCKS